MTREREISPPKKKKKSAWITPWDEMIILIPSVSRISNKKKIAFKRILLTFLIHEYVKSGFIIRLWWILWSRMDMTMTMTDSACPLAKRSNQHTQGDWRHLRVRMSFFSLTSYSILGSGLYVEFPFVSTARQAKVRSTVISFSEHITLTARRCFVTGRSGLSWSGNVRPILPPTGEQTQLMLSCHMATRLTHLSLLMSDVLMWGVGYTD